MRRPHKVANEKGRGLTRPFNWLSSSLIVVGAEGVGTVLSGVVPHLEQQIGFIVSGASGDPEEDFGDADAAEVERRFAEVDEDDGRLYEAAGIELGSSIDEVVVIARGREVGVLFVGASIEASARIGEEADIIEFDKVTVEGGFVGVNRVVGIVGGILVSVNGREGEGAAINRGVTGTGPPVVLEILEAFLGFVAGFVVFSDVDEIELFSAGAIDDALFFGSVERRFEFVVGGIFSLISEVGPFEQSVSELIGLAADIVGIAGFSFEGFLLGHVIGGGSPNAEGLNPRGRLRDGEYDGEDRANDQQGLNPSGFADPTPEFGKRCADAFQNVHRMRKPPKKCGPERTAG